MGDERSGSRMFPLDARGVTPRSYDMEIAALGAFDSAKIFTSHDEYLSYCEGLADQANANGARMPRDFVYRYYGTEMLSRLLPEVVRARISIYPTKTSEYEKTFPVLLSALPKSINGTSTEDIVRAIGDKFEILATRADDMSDLPYSKFAFANGNCTIMSSLFIQMLRTANVPNVQSITVSAPHQKLENPPFFRPISNSHTLFGIRFQQDGRSFVFVCDPTVAQTDKEDEQDADIEFAVVPVEQLTDYLHLRYRAQSNIPPRLG